MSFHVPEDYRVRTGQSASSPRDGNNGAFFMPSRINSRVLCIVASDGLGWEHVSVHAEEKRGHRQWIPTWEEMCLIKDLFWDAEDVVIQYHPRASEYCNYHPFTLHLWRPVGVEIPTPDPILVGPRT